MLPRLKHGPSEKKKGTHMARRTRTVTEDKNHQNQGGACVSEERGSGRPVIMDNCSRKRLVQSGEKRKGGETSESTPLTDLPEVRKLIVRSRTAGKLPPA